MSLEHVLLQYQEMVSQPLHIRGMAWDHPRALNPLNAISEMWSQHRSETVHWEARPLKAFEDQPLEELAACYDLVLMDYPFVGTAAQSGLIVPVDEWVDTDYLLDQARNSVGPSYVSYTWSGKQWALAIDAATQVSAVRQDLLQRAAPQKLPDNWNDVAKLARQCRGLSSRVAIPLNPNHAYCAFLSVGLANQGASFWPVGGIFDRAAALTALEFLQGLAPDLHPLSQSSDPIAVSDRMANTDEILLVPLMFGYSNYARPGFRNNRLRFGNAPTGTSGHIGSVLGGVGIALSARSNQLTASAELARLMASPGIQSGLYVESGGQPGHAAAWASASANALVDGFFQATRETMEQAFLRPRVPGHRKFQEQAGVAIHRAIWEQKASVETCLDELFGLANELLGEWV